MSLILVISYTERDNDGGVEEEQHLHVPVSLFSEMFFHHLKDPQKIHDNYETAAPGLNFFFYQINLIHSYQLVLAN